MKIYKYPVPIADYFTIDIPLGGEILSFQTQNDVMMIWVAVWPNSSTEERKFSIIGTGHAIDMDEVKKWYKSKGISDDEILVLTPKFDGLSVAAPVLV